MINKIHKTVNSLLKKHYTIEFYTDNNFTIILSFYHLNSVYNGLCYISKDSDYINIDFQYHKYNKAVHEQLKRICENISKLNKLNQLQTALNILNNYKPLANQIYKENYSIYGGVAN
jgi:archaellum component FlaF (FlaF/FlaG flagellin family)